MPKTSRKKLALMPKPFRNRIEIDVHMACQRVPGSWDREFKVGLFGFLGVESHRGYEIVGFLCVLDGFDKDSNSSSEHQRR